MATRGCAGASSQSEKKALGKELAQKITAVGAQRQANRELSLPRQRARQQKICQVGAGDDQHAERCSTQAHEQKARFRGEFIAQRDHGQVDRFVLFWILPPQPGGDQQQFAARLGERYTRLEPSDPY